MELIISKEAREYIEKKVPNVQKIVLDFEDGDSPLELNAVSCALDVSFRLFLLHEAEEAIVDFSNYQAILNTSIGDIYLKESSKRYLDEHTRLIFDSNYMRLQLKGENTGMIANSVEIYEV